MNRLTHIVEIVNNHLGLNCREKSHKTKYIQARWMYYKLAHNYTNAILSDIGKEVSVHHATVLNALEKRIANPNYFNRELQAVYLAIETKFREKYPAYVEEIKPFKRETSNFYEEITLLNIENRKLHRRIVKQAKVNRYSQTSISSLKTRIIKLEKQLTPVIKEKDKYKELYLALLLKH